MKKILLFSFLAVIFGCGNEHGLGQSPNTHDLVAAKNISNATFCEILV
jgi:hypothetical protein